MSLFTGVVLLGVVLAALTIGIWWKKTNVVEMLAFGVIYWLCAWVVTAMGFFVLDSLTTPDSQLGVQARALGMVSAVRDVFLDTRRQTPDILSALDQAAAKARARGYAVAIGHPYEETLRALRTWQDKEQVALVPLRRLVWRLAQEKAAGTAHIPAR